MDMKINIKTTTISLTPAISDYVEKNLSSIKKLLENDTTAQCDLELAKTTNHHKHGDIFKAEIHIVAKETNIFSSVEKEDLYAAIDEARNEVIQAIKSAKEKKITSERKGGAEIKNIIKGL